MTQELTLPGFEQFEKQPRIQAQTTARNAPARRAQRRGAFAQIRRWLDQAAGIFPARRRAEFPERPLTWLQPDRRPRFSSSGPGTLCLLSRTLP